MGWCFHFVLMPSGMIPMMLVTCIRIVLVVVDYDTDESTRRNVEDGGYVPSVDRYAPGRSVAARNKQQINAG
ncbi:unnamed protein product [Strongylus vulgaris]|uniref:Uncharacterized protein n=1 Tax=Strongylus vulgaris TaxID=40348 RepID=A0A3P7LF38_STRVU|nr:unnamed protein product [Strongylus vulgaris]